MWNINDRYSPPTLLINNTCHSTLTYPTTITLIASCCIIGLISTILQIYHLHHINPQQQQQPTSIISTQQKNMLLYLGNKIADGAQSFLKQEYKICLIFITAMSIVIGIVTQYTWWTAVAFLIGALNCMLCGIIGIAIATQTNYRVSYCAKDSLTKAFHTAYRGSCSMGFALVSLGLLVLLTLIVIYKRMMDLPDYSSNPNTYQKLFQTVAGYGLGGSFVTLFSRVGGGIYTKAADVGADMVGKIQSGLNQDSPYNPATIADNVGDNVGDVAGMSADLFGSFAESTCAALVISSNTLIGPNCDFYLSNLFYPLLLIAFGIIICIFVSAFAFRSKIELQDKIQSILKGQLIISTLLLIGAFMFVSVMVLPQQFGSRFQGKKTITIRSPYHAFLCSLLGLVSGLVIASYTEYVTSHNYYPAIKLIKSCLYGPAANITLGLALGYTSTALPAIFIAFTAYYANYWLGYYGIALAALGMLANLPILLATDAYGPITDNASCIAEMSGLGEQLKAITKALDAAGITTASIGKGFSVGSASLVALALYGGFLHNTRLQSSNQISITEPLIFTGLLVGAMLPYIFSAFTIKSVGKAAEAMVKEVRRQIKQNPGILTGQLQPDYNACITISADASLIEMIIPGLLVISTPLVIGFAFGPKIIAGFIPGTIISAVMVATSAVNSGGTWRHAKKYIQTSGITDQNNITYVQGSQAHKAAVVGDTVGDPLKDTSGPALNILMKLTAIISLIFGSNYISVHPIN